MASAAQIEANRKNAQMSTGPVTPQGKARSGRNAIRHGLLSTVIPINAPGYQELLVGLYTSLTPQNELQRMMVDQIAITTMRLRRIWGAEQSYLYTKAGNWPDGPDANAASVHTYLEVPAAVTYLRYESMLNRLLARLLRQYHEIRCGENWAEISRSDSPYIQRAVAEHPANEAPTEQQVAAVGIPPANGVPPSSKLPTMRPPELGAGTRRAGGGAKCVVEDSPEPSVEERTMESAAPPEIEQTSHSTMNPDVEARIAALAKIPYNEFLVQSRVAAYDARRDQYGGS